MGRKAADTRTDAEKKADMKTRIVRARAGLEKKTKEFIELPNIKSVLSPAMQDIIVAMLGGKSVTDAEHLLPYASQLQGVSYGSPWAGRAGILPGLQKNKEDIATAATSTSATTPATPNFNDSTTTSAPVDQPNPIVPTNPTFIASMQQPSTPAKTTGIPGQFIPGSSAQPGAIDALTTTRPSYDELLAMVQGDMRERLLRGQSVGVQSMLQATQSQAADNLGGFGDSAKHEEAGDDLRVQTQHYADDPATPFPNGVEDHNYAFYESTDSQINAFDDADLNIGQYSSGPRPQSFSESQMREMQRRVNSAARIVPSEIRLSTTVRFLTHLLMEQLGVDVTQNIESFMEQARDEHALMNMNRNVRFNSAFRHPTRQASSGASTFATGQPSMSSLSATHNDDRYYPDTERRRLN
ncbi:hypothetical protein CGLO_05673 [Colletotrichum gloeosporioides Cg-14]|uniref:Uncharacterized protein n=1 Tax=Colletotrichum gloeosporioides (strain Cg-14) TaxID=1237896 RepID=T0KQZ9_COLGC|nr:hypothetical protein CGLO_05673 [Colletotrichum gloeosporioides Cg-14]